MKYMKTIIKTKGKINARMIGLSFIICHLSFSSALFSCSDFDDYNKEVSDATATGNLTLWENIQQNTQLSDFKELVSRAGFDDKLNTSHYYTVWAPVNGSYDAAVLRKLGNEALLKQFVLNHVADYGHNASGTINERVHTLNGKSYDFTGSTTYTFDDIAVSQANLPSNNGVMHLLDGMAQYYANMYEYVTDSSLSVGKGIDSLIHHFKRYEVIRLDEQNSVVGPIVDGVQTYIDSVLIVENVLLGRDGLRAELDEEDSTYTMLLPTNKAWVNTYNRIRPYYNYLPTTKAQGYITQNNKTERTGLVSVDIDAEQMKDSLTKRMLTQNLVFSNNNGYNQWLNGNAHPAYGSDTLFTTTRNKLSNPKDILGQAKEKVKMSNGIGYLTDSLAIYSWESYAPEITVWPRMANSRAHVVNGNGHSVHVINPAAWTGELFQQNPYYYWLEPTGPYAIPELRLYLDNVLSATYELYCVFYPNIVTTDSSVVRQPNRVSFTLSYCDADGSMKDYVFENQNADSVASFKERFPSAAEKPDYYNAYENDPTKVDTLHIGQFTFPVCYYGLSTDNDRISPNLKITTPFNAFDRELMAAYARDLRIVAIILKPVEMDAANGLNDK